MGVCNLFRGSYSYSREIMLSVGARTKFPSSGGTTGGGGGGGGHTPPPPTQTARGGGGASGLVAGRAPANAMICSHYLHAS